MKQKYSIPLFLIVTLALFSSAAVAQKIKYKDLFLLLDANDFKKGEAPLKQFLGEEKNQDHPNAHFQLGKLYEYKAKQDHLLRETQTFHDHTDSAILYFGKALNLITEKEIKRNDDYYAAFNRRDLRTGKFGIKLSDVHLDIEQRMESLQAQTTNALQLSRTFEAMISDYREAQKQYGQLKQQFAGMNQLYLQADEATLKQLGRLESGMDNFLAGFSAYQPMLPKSREQVYPATLTMNKIEGLIEAPLAQVDFFAEEIVVVDFKLWAENVRSTVQKEIMSVKKQLIESDMWLNDLKEQLSTQSISIKKTLESAHFEPLEEALAPYGQKHLPLTLLNYKLGDLHYKSQLNTIESHQDSANVYYQYDLAARRLSLAESKQKVMEDYFEGSDDKDWVINEALKNYSTFFEKRFGGEASLKQYLSGVDTLNRDDLQKSTAYLQSCLSATQYGLYGQDSIYIVPVHRDTTALNQTYTTLELDSLPDQKMAVAGIFQKQTANLKAFYFEVDPSRRIWELTSLKLNSIWSEADKTKMTAHLLKMAGGEIYLLYVNEQSVKEKFQAQLFKINTDKKMIWSRSLSCSLMPTDIVADEGNTMIFIPYATTAEGTATGFKVHQNGQLIGE